MQGKVLTVPLPGSPSPFHIPLALQSHPQRDALNILHAALPWAALVLLYFRLLSLHNLLWLTAPSEPTETVSRGHWWPNSLAWGSGKEAWPGDLPDPWLLTAGCLRTFPTLAVCLVCTLFFYVDGFYFSTLKLRFLTEGLRLSEATARCVSAHLAMVSLFTLFSMLPPCHFLHWLEENQAMVSRSALPSSPFNNSPWEMSTGMNKNTN